MPRRRTPNYETELKKLKKELKVAEIQQQLKEVKRSRFGRPTFVDVTDKVQFSIRKAPIVDWDRKQVYEHAYRLYLNNQFARPIINILASALLRNPPDFQGEEDLVKEALNIIEDSKLDWYELGIEYWLFGEVYLKIFEEADEMFVRSLPPSSVEIAVNQGDVKDVDVYIQYKGTDIEIVTKPEDIVHIKTNAVSNQLYGESELKQTFWWLDVYDALWEKGWIRTSLYFGAPVVVIEGIPANAQAAIENELRTTGWKPGKALILPGGVERERPQAKVLNFGEGFEMQNLVDRVFKAIVTASGIPQSLLMESDASRGVAMFSQPAFEFKIQSAQNKWNIGLKDLFVRMFKRKGMVGAEKKLSEIDFKIAWLPIFNRDDKDLIKGLVELVEKRVISKKTAREKLNIDNSEEEERLKKEKSENEAAGLDPITGLSKPDPALAAPNGGTAARPVQKSVRTGPKR